MKLSILIIGIIIFIIGCFTKTKLSIAIGIIIILVSFFGKRAKEEGITENQKKEAKQKRKCSNCEAEILEDDNYCQECGKKVIP